MNIDYLLRVFPESCHDAIRHAAQHVDSLDAVDGHTQADISVKDGLRTVLTALAVEGPFEDDSYWDAIIMIQQIIEAQ